MRVVFGLSLASLVALATVLVVSMLTGGCSSVTGVLYGPDMTPIELKNAVYDDAYALGAMRAAGATAEQLSAYREKAVYVKGLADPESYFTAEFMRALKEGDQQNAFIFYTARRLYKSVGAKLVKDNVDLEGMDVDLFVWAVGAYIDGLDGR